MATPSEIDAQVRLERDQIKKGLEKLHSNTKKLERKDYASASVYGVTSIQALIPIVAKSLDKEKSHLRERHTGYAFRDIIQFLSDLEPEVAAAIGCKVTFDKVFSPKKGASKLQSVTDAIGTAIENECLIRHYERECPNLLRVIKERYWHEACGTAQKVKVVKNRINKKEDVDLWRPWGSERRIRLGGWLLDHICRADDWFTRTTLWEGKKRSNYVIPTPHFIEIKDKVMRDAELFSPIALPMLIEPNDWSNDKAGGYLLNECMRGYPMVRRGKCRLLQGETPIAFLNHVQKTAYKLNDFVVDVAEELMEKGVKIGKFVPVFEMPLPPKPVDIATNKESRHDYNRRAAEVYNINAKAFQKSCRTRMIMNAVKMFKGKIFFQPHSLDYRGRCYPIPSVLSMQDTDFAKSLLNFAESAFITPEAEDWIRFQCATTAGLDKEPIDIRLKWTYENEDRICRVAQDPIGNLSDWADVEEPWCFLAACDAMYHEIILCDRQMTCLPIATDATASGLQVLAGLSRDASTAKLCNVIPSERPQDAYKKVAETAKPNIPQHLQQYWDRKAVKRVVMTLPYAAQIYSNRIYIREAFKDRDIDVEKDDLTVCVKAVRESMAEVFPGPMRVMHWIQSEVCKAIDRGAEQLQWVTPSGFVVTQRLMKSKTKEISLSLLGRCRVAIATEEEEKVDRQHHKNATSANLIHSLDSSLLHLSAIRFHAPIALIHDSVVCRATDMSTLSTIVRETYMHLFAENDYLHTFSEHIGAETKPPIIGDLEPESVIESTYFFC